MIKVIVISCIGRKADFFPKHMTLRKAMEEFSPEYAGSISVINGRPKSADSLDQPLHDLAEHNIVRVGCLGDIAMNSETCKPCVPESSEPLPSPDEGKTVPDSELPF